MKAIERIDAEAKTGGGFIIPDARKEKPQQSKVIAVVPGGTTKPAGGNFLQQQAKFDDFIECYNNERPHQALNMQRPAERYLPSTRPYRGLPELDYPFHDRTATVTTCGRICFDRRKINPSKV